MCFDWKKIDVARQMCFGAKMEKILLTFVETECLSGLPYFFYGERENPALQTE